MISEAYNIDCLNLMAGIKHGSLDFICEDPPYGSTQLSWDRELNYKEYFEQRWPLLKPNGVIAVFSHQPYATDIINACRKYFRYDFIFKKTQKTNAANAKKMPLRGHELILIFYKKQPTFNQQRYYNATSKGRRVRRSSNEGKIFDGYGGGWAETYNYNCDDGMILYDSVLSFSNWNGAIFGDSSNASINPTQKPLPLVTLLIEMFTNPGDTVMDGFFGSGTTRIACYDTGRNFYGSELRESQFLSQEKRFAKHISQTKLFTPQQAPMVQIKLL